MQGSTQEGPGRQPLRPSQKRVYGSLLSPARRVLTGLFSLVAALGLIAQLGACRTPPTPDDPQAEPTTDEEPAEGDSSPELEDDEDDEDGD